MQRLDGGGDSGHRWAPRPARRRRWRLREARELVQVSTPVSRRISSTSLGSPAPTPVCAGLTTATRSPRACTSATSATTTTVLLNPVPVLATTRAVTSHGPAAAVATIACANAERSSSS